MTDEATWSNIAGPRIPISRELYTGAELQSRSVRPGAYDAFALPSREGSRIVTPDERRVEAPTPASTNAAAMRLQPVPLLHRAAPPPITGPWPAKKDLGCYSPRAGSVAQGVLNVLQRDGGHLTTYVIAARFNVKPHAVLGLLKTPIDRGALIRHQVGRRAFISLPGYDMPELAPDAEETTPVPCPAAPAPAPWPPAPPIERAPEPADAAVDQAAGDLAQIAASAAGLAAAFAQLEAQTLAVAELMGDALHRFSTHLSHLAAVSR